jgi:hypothetical protein
MAQLMSLWLGLRRRVARRSLADRGSQYASRD